MEGSALIIDARSADVKAATHRLRVAARRIAAWQVLLASIPFLAIFYLLLPVTGTARTIAYPAYGLIAVIAILVGVRRRGPARRRSWRMIALAVALLSVGDLIYSVLAIDGAEVPYPSIADIAYLAGYVSLIVGVTGLIRGRAPGGDRTPIIDAAILAAGAGSLFWVAVVQPTLSGAVDPIVGAVSMAYPGMDLILLALGLRVLFTAAARPRYLQILVAGVSVYFIADVIYAVLLVNQAYTESSSVDAGWIVGILMIGAAALHPSVADPIPTVRAAEANLSRTRLAMLSLAAFIAPTILIVKDVGAHDDVAMGLVIEWTVLFALVLLRLTTTVHELARSLTERRHLQVDLAHQAQHDPLTKLGNRLLFESHLRAAMAASPERTAMIFLDLDDFKTINDTLGHGVGDELLKILAARLEHVLRDSDLGARLGGDEFAILIDGCESAAAARSVAERALETLRRPVSLEDRQLVVHASAGVAMGRRDLTVTDLMRNADVAMYQAKSHGKDQVETYEEAMHGQVIRGYELRTELAAAISANQFVVHYQPAVNLTNGMVVGAEALVRWNHPERGLIGPLDFIPQAESSGLIQALGRWILREACMTAATWPDRPDGERPAVSVNLAASQLAHPTIVDDVAAVLAETHLPANKLVLEVTESALVDLCHAREALGRLKGLGVNLALDDFGTGYSALSYVAELPFDIVKIDQTFVASIGQGRRVDALLEGILGLCDALELTTVAEGIETTAQLARLTGLGCRIGQGYLFARPVPSAEFAVLLHEIGAEKRLAHVPQPHPARRITTAATRRGAPAPTAGR